MVTVVSPPASRQSGASPGRRPACARRASATSCAAVRRASPLMAVVRMRGTKPHRAGLVRRRFQGLFHRGHEHVADAPESRFVRLRRFRGAALEPSFDMCPDRLRHFPAQAVMLHYPQAIGEGARIGHGGAGGDDVKVVAYHIGYDEPEHGGREGRAHEAASAEAGKVFAQRIDLMDCRSAFQQHTGKPLHVGQRDFRMAGRG